MHRRANIIDIESECMLRLRPQDIIRTVYNSCLAVFIMQELSNASVTKRKQW